ncbi:hypothetical protein P879_06009 [Paragonimus westermani]|uniref:Uncharacterized protein n=1 Tax=Paragonimus westermani TaxID=34504 RepID=A0A8T0D3G7_9TREM|nr:hypothetical protein P879_06009 [Paragonimus westermani]
MRRPSVDPLQLKNDMVGRKRVLSQPLSLITSQPFLAPFVPDLLRWLVNGIESYCYEHSWSVVYSPLNEYHNEAVLAFQLIDINNDPGATEKFIGRLQHPVQILVVRPFLNELGMKLLHCNGSLMHKLSQFPLFDFFLRPHPGSKKVQNAALQSYCGHVNTGVLDDSLVAHLGVRRQTFGCQTEIGSHLRTFVDHFRRETGATWFWFR